MILKLRVVTVTLRGSGVVAGVTVEALLPTSTRKKVRGVAWSLGVLLFAANSGLAPASWGRTPVDSYQVPPESPVFHFHCGYYATEQGKKTSHG